MTEPSKLAMEYYKKLSFGKTTDDGGLILSKAEILSALDDFADAHLRSLWHGPEEVPERNKPFVMENETISVDYYFQYPVGKRWAYLSDLRGGK